MNLTKIVFDKEGRILQGPERSKHLKKLGLCEFCADKRVAIPDVERRLGGRRVSILRPITDREVYQGMHVSCYGGFEALIKQLQRKNQDVTKLTKMWQEDQIRRYNPPRQVVCDEEETTHLSDLTPGQFSAQSQSVCRRDNNNRSTSMVPSELPNLDKRVPSIERKLEFALLYLKSTEANVGTILEHLRKNLKEYGLSLLYPSLQRLLDVSTSFNSYSAGWIEILHHIILRRYYTTHRNITIHTLDILIKCAFNCHQFESTWNDVISFLFKHILPYHIQNVDVLVRACTLISCIFMSYSMQPQSSENHSFIDLGDNLHELCQIHLTNERLLEAACTAWMYLVNYEKPKEPKQPQWMKIAISQFPNNEYLWSFLSLLCKNTQSTPQTREWIKEIIIQNFPINNWSDTQAWCLYNASIHSKKNFILRPESFWIVTGSLFHNRRQDSAINVLTLWHSEHIVASPILEQKIIEILELFKENLGLIEVACTLLSRMEISTPDKTIGSILKHVKRFGLQTASYCALRSFLQSSAARNARSKKIVKQMNVTLKSLLLTSHSPQTVSLLWFMCCNNSEVGNAKELANSCGAGIVSKAVANHSGDDQLLGLLTYLLNEAPNEMAIHLNERVHEVVREMLSIMKTSQDSNLIELASKIIAILSNNEIWKLFLLQRQDLISTILTCIDKCSVSIKSDIFQIISNVAEDSEDSEDIRFILSHDILNHVLNSFVDITFVFDNEYESNALKLLSILLPHTLPQSLVNGKGVIMCIVGILKRRIGEELVSKYCLLVLANLLLKVKHDAFNDPFKIILSQKDIIRVIIDAMSKHLGCESIQIKGCLILWELSKDEEAKSLIADLDGIRLMLIVLQCHLKNVVLQEAGLCLLTSMSCIPRMRNILIANGSSDVILAILWVNFEKESIIKNGFDVMSNLVVDIQTNEIDLVCRQEMEIIIAAMDYFPLSCKIQVSACRLLRNLSLAEENINFMMNFREQLTSALITACSNFPAECGERVNFIFNRTKVT